MWDVVSTKRAIQIAEEVRQQAAGKGMGGDGRVERMSGRPPRCGVWQAKGNVDVVDDQGFHTSTELMAEALMNCARRSRTQDNTTVLTIDFQSSR